MSRDIFHEIGVLLTTVAVAVVLAGTWFVPSTYVGAVPTEQQLPGTCKAFADIQEFYTLSDVSPPVPCDGPHQTEVYRIGVYGGPLAKHQKLTLEAMARIRDSLCRDQEAVRTYLGARPQDSVWGLNVLVRLPTPGEWAAGERGYRCELTPVPDGKRVPRLTRPLADVLRGQDAARWRHCADGSRPVTCDREHTAEYVNAWLPVPARVPLAEWAERECADYVTAYLASPAEAVGARVGALEVRGAASRTAACVAIPPRRTTGSLVVENTR